MTKNTQPKKSQVIHSNIKNNLKLDFIPYGLALEFYGKKKEELMNNLAAITKIIIDDSNDSARV